MTITTSDPSNGLRPYEDEAVRSADEREVTGVVLRIATDHPDIEPSEIEAALRTALDRTAGAPVQTYRLVLAERDVRARLRAAGSRPRR